MLSSFLSTVSPLQEREIVFLPPPLEEESLPGDLFSVLFKCEAHDTPWRALLAHCIALQRPLLAILAACYKVDMCVHSLHSLILRIHNLSKQEGWIQLNHGNATRMTYSCI